jgi:hypothetical protein
LFVCYVRASGYAEMTAFNIFSERAFLNAAPLLHVFYLTVGIIMMMMMMSCSATVTSLGAVNTRKSACAHHCSVVLQSPR